MYAGGGNKGDYLKKFKKTVLTIENKEMVTRGEVGGGVGERGEGD